MPNTTGEQTQRDDLIVIAGAGGFIAGALTRYFHERGFTRIRAVDKKPLPEWYQRVAGRGVPESRLQPRRELPPRLRRGRGSLQSGGRHGRHGVHRAVSCRVLAEHSGQHAHDRSRVSGRRTAVLLLVVRVCLQHGPAEGSAGPRT